LCDGPDVPTYECLAYGVVDSLRKALEERGDNVLTAYFVHGLVEARSPDGVVVNRPLFAPAERQLDRRTCDDGFVIGTYEYRDGSRIYVRGSVVLPFTVEDLHQLDPEDIAALFEEVAANPGMVGWRDPEDR
jgi:hypothetical protein